VDPIAIVGIGCRFPGGVDSPSSFWKLLREGRDATSSVPSERLLLSGHARVGHGGYLRRVDLFDAPFFRISPKEAASMDPQQRMLLQTAWEALEDAGERPDLLAKTPVGVFVGISSSDYGILTAVSRPQGFITGTARSIASNRISYAFDFRGPSVSVDTACSSSLTALHLAVQSLQLKESSLALVGGANLILAPLISEGMSGLGALAPDGRCKTFDASADGYGRGEGIAVVVLKRLSDALSAGDLLYAVVRGTAVNQDGKTNGLTAPNRRAQEAVIRTALERAGVPGAELSCLEAHGTGTLLGDPIESQALGAVLGADRPASQPLWVGSVKTNLGHLEACSGIAGLIKLALSLEARELPPSLHFKTPNPHIDFESLKLRVPTSLVPLPQNALGGVSSFGFGGTNAHAVLGGLGPAVPETRATSGRKQLLLLSARSAPSLLALRRKYARWLDSPDTARWDEVCWNAFATRARQDVRSFVVAEDKAQAVRLLNTPQAPRKARPGKRKVCFVFGGQGSQWKGMIQVLQRGFPAARAALEELEGPYRQWVGTSPTVEAEDGIASMGPSLFVAQWTLAAVLRAAGVLPHLVMGHSMGEVAAACVSGALSVSDGLRIAVHRNRLLATIEGKGAMLYVEHPVEAVSGLLRGVEHQVSVSGIHSPRSFTLAGDKGALEALARTLLSTDVFCRPIKVDVAAHCPSVEPLQAPLEAALEGLSPGPTGVPFVSTVTGGLAGGETLGPKYWSANLRQPVRLWDATRTASELGCDTWLEVSPHSLLKAGLSQSLEALGNAAEVFSTLRRHEDEGALLECLGNLFSVGVELDERGLPFESRQRVRLPTYAWDEESHWFEGRGAHTETIARPPVETEREPETWMEAVSRITGLPPDRIDAEAPVNRLGLDSLMAMQLSKALGRLTGREVPLARFFQDVPLSEFLAPATFRRWTAVSSKPSLIFIHPGGFPTERYARWAAALESVCQLEVAETDPFAESIEAAADRVAKALGDRPAGSPVSLGGWSLGSIVAVEATRRLLARGRQVSALVLMDPALLRRDKPPEDEDAAWLAGFVAFLGARFEKATTLGYDQLRTIPASERRQLALEQASLVGALGPAPSQALFEDMLELYREGVRASVRRLETVQGSPPVPVPSLWLRAEQGLDGTVPRGDSLSHLVVGPPAIHDIPANHYSLFVGQPPVGAVDALVAYLGGVARRST
jgi:acyl transferase domain-containing protein